LLLGKLLRIEALPDPLPKFAMSRMLAIGERL